MTRVNIYARGAAADTRVAEGKSALIGWFDDASCTEHIAEGREWNGNSHVGVLSGLEAGHEALLRTAKGRWVRHYDSTREFNGPEFYEFLTDDQARGWLIRNNDESSERILTEYFGEVEEESGPNLGGRPAIGKKLEVRLDAETLAKVDDRASEEGVSRAELLRRLIVAGL